MVLALKISKILALVFIKRQKNAHKAFSKDLVEEKTIRLWS